MGEAELPSLPEPPAPLPAQRRGPRVLLASAAAFVVLLVALATGIGWALRSESGTAWLLALAPGVLVEAPKGLLLGDFEARRVQIRLPGSDASVTLANVGWSGLTLTRGEAGRWFRLVVEELHAGRVDVLMAPNKTSEPLRQPAELKWPFEIEVRALSVTELRFSALGDKPLLDLSAQLHLGAAGGAEHRIEQLRLGWDRLQARGSARIASGAPMQLYPGIPK